MMLLIYMLFHWCRLTYVQEAAIVNYGKEKCIFSPCFPCNATSGHKMKEAYPPVIITIITS